MQVSTTVELSGREIEFVRGLADGLAPTTAAKTAGYSVGHAKALLAKAHIQAALFAMAKNASSVLRERSA